MRGHDATHGRLAHERWQGHHARMPELPEVETTRRGLLPHVAGRRIQHVLLRRADLALFQAKRAGRNRVGASDGP